MHNSLMNTLKSFKYVASKNAIILILGSMPSKESLFQNQYYAHPKNLFWEAMGQMFGFNKSLPYHERLASLQQNKIALWDVVYQCKRKGSLDANITSVKVNDFSSFSQNHPNIKTLFFNGKKAEELYKRFVIKEQSLGFVDLDYYLLPSTSPANASIAKAEKINRWLKVKEYLYTQVD